VFSDSKENIPEFIIRSLPDETAGEKGFQNQSIYHRLRYRDVLVNIMAQRLKIANIKPTGFDVLSRKT